jgi:hypothetical protein
VIKAHKLELKKINLKKKKQMKRYKIKFMDMYKNVLKCSSDHVTNMVVKWIKITFVALLTQEFRLWMK